MKTVTLTSFLIAFLLGLSSVAFSCEPPQILSISCNAGNVMIQFESEVSQSIQGFNFYCDDEFAGFLPYSGDSVYTHFLVYQSPGEHDYCITTLCTVSTLAMISETIESDPDCESVGCFYGFDLPFEEDWALGSFSPNDWEISSSNWILAENTGNDPPAALFEPTDPLTDYSESLESYFLNASGMTEGNIYLEYDISLSSAGASGNEHLLVQVWDHLSESYSNVKEFSNQNGSFGWTRDTIDIRPYSMNKVFRIRFLAQGESSSDINYWGIDNILIHRECSCPLTPDSYLINDTCIVLQTLEITRADIVDYWVYVEKDGEFIMFDPINSFPNPYCVNESGVYCFYLTAIWESETDQCQSDFSEPACEQVIINSLKDEKTPVEISCRIEDDFLWIQSTEIIDRLDIYDLSGRKTLSASPGTDSFSQNLSHLKSGLYVIRAETSGKVFLKKLIIP
jgi:hypothetical protein